MIKDLDAKEITKTVNTIPHSTPDTIIGTQTIIKYCISDMEPKLRKTLELNPDNTSHTIIRTIIKKQYYDITSNEKRVIREFTEYHINDKAFHIK